MRDTVGARTRTPLQDTVRTLLHTWCHQLVLICSCKTQHILSRGSRHIVVAPSLRPHCWPASAVNSGVRYSRGRRDCLRDDNVARGCVHRTCARRDRSASSCRVAAPSTSHQPLPWSQHTLRQLVQCWRIVFRLPQSGVQHVESGANSERGLLACPRDYEPSNYRSQPCPTLSTSSGSRASTPGWRPWRCSLPMRIHLSTTVRRNAFKRMRIPWLICTIVWTHDFEGEEECLIVFGNVFTAMHESLQQRHPERRRSTVQSLKQPSIPNVARDEPEWLFSVPPWLQTIENSMAETLERFESTFTFLPRSEAIRSDRHRPV